MGEPQVVRCTQIHDRLLGLSTQATPMDNLTLVAPGLHELILLGAGFLIGFATHAVLGGGRRRLAQELLDRQETRRQAETEALLDGVKTAFGEISEAAQRRTADEVVRLAQATLGAERRLQGQQVAAERSEFEARIGVILTQLERMQGLIRELERDRASKFGELAARLDAAGRDTKALVAQTRALATALGNVRVRGQWGERMAEDVLRTAGLVEGVSYRRQSALADGGRPDFTFLLPGDLVLHMDVKFPFENWVRLVEAEDQDARTRAATAFVRDVRARIGEVAARGYVAPAAGTLDFALLFVPSEPVLSAALDIDPGLVDEALRRNVVLASPATLFAVLAIVRRTAAALRLSAAGSELARLLVGLREAWAAHAAETERVGRALDDAARAMERLRLGRSRTVERRLAAIERVADGQGPSPAEPPAAVRPDA
jgi:DNA recombination protein RmuC